MARPRTIDPTRILQVARELFLERGCDVPTADIARAAGISEGSIFRRYPTKHDLFLAAMGLDRPRWTEGLAERAGQATVRENITQLVREGIAFFEEMLPRMMLVWSRREAAPTAEQQKIAHEGPRLALEKLTHYFEAERALGRIAIATPEVTARMVLAAIANYAFFKTMGVHGRGTLGAEQYAHEVAETLWRGIQPPASATPPQAPAQDER